MHLTSEKTAMGDPEKRKAVLQARRDEQISAAKKRTAESQERIDAVKNK